MASQQKKRKMKVIEKYWSGKCVGIGLIPDIKCLCHTLDLIMIKIIVESIEYGRLRGRSKKCLTHFKKGH
jgi:hypothetical protein